MGKTRQALLRRASRLRLYKLRIVGLLALVLGLVAAPVWLYERGHTVLQRLHSRQIPTLSVRDRHGVLLRHHSQMPGLRLQPVRLAEMPPLLVSAVLAAEDRRFYEHLGVDPWALCRAAWLDWQTRSWRFGASTITMQLVRMSGDPHAPRTLVRKVREMIDAMALERVRNKAAILQDYLNRVDFGHGTQGIEAAAQHYFDQPARALSAQQALLLAVLVRGPSYYDFDRHPDRVIKRRNHIVGLLARHRMISSEVAAQVVAESRVEPRATSDRAFGAPHAVDHLLHELPTSWLQQGGTVLSTLDLGLQDNLQRAVAHHVEQSRSRGVTHAAAVIMAAQTGEVWAMVGSADYHSQDGGAINMATWRRHPGSTLKPFVYALAIEQGLSPSSLVYDLLEAVPPGYARPDLREHGPVTLREALAGSYNLAALELISRVGVGAVHARMMQAGLAFGDVDVHAYGPGLALGAAKVRLLDLAAAYAVFLNDGVWRRPNWWRSYVNHQGIAVTPKPSSTVAVFSRESAALTRDILADAQARRSVFGEDLPTDLPFPIVVKTGTASGFADTWAVFASQEWIVATWSGRLDGRPTQGVLGMQGAAPLARAGLLLASQGRVQRLPALPTNLREERLCTVSGLAATSACPVVRTAAFVPNAAAPVPCTWHQPNGSIDRARVPPAVAAWWQRNPGAMVMHAQSGDSSSVEARVP